MEALKGNIRLETANIEKDILPRTAFSLQRRVQMCRAECGGLFEHFV
jgi:hypothetical protein